MDWFRTCLSDPNAYNPDKEEVGVSPENAAFAIYYAEYKAQLARDEVSRLATIVRQEAEDQDNAFVSRYRSYLATKKR